MKISWVPLVGTVEVVGNEITYVAKTVAEGPNAGQLQVALVKSNINFESGEAAFSVILKDSRCACQLILSHGLSDELCVGLRHGGYGIAKYRNGAWDFIAATGSAELPVGRPIAIRVRVRGSQIDLFVDEVKVCSAVESVQASQLALFLQGPDNFTVKEFSAIVQRPKVFVVMQFSEPFNELYNDVIRPTCEAFDYEVIRADDIYKTGLIIEDITKSIREASVVIADITLDNPNVFYEVGYAHASKKTTILLSDRRRDKLPFDVSGFRTLFYDNTIGGKGAVEANLKKHLESLEGYQGM
jgi:hypothetical protein